MFSPAVLRRSCRRKRSNRATAALEAGTIRDRLNKMPIRISLNDDGEVVGVTNNKGHPLPHIFAFWFAWQAFNPETTVYGAK